MNGLKDTGQQKETAMSREEDIAVLFNGPASGRKNGPYLVEAVASELVR